MKSATGMLIVGIIFGTAASSNAQVPRSWQNQITNSIRKASQSNFSHRVTAKTRNFGGGHGQGTPGHWSPPGHGFPAPPCDGGYCPPPRPPICHVYIVYYYDCHQGWVTYGTYPSHYAAQSAVRSLQNQGYRTYLKKVAR